MRLPFINGSGSGFRLGAQRPAEEVIEVVLEMSQRPQTEVQVVKKGLLGRREERVEVPTKSTFRFLFEPADYGWQYREARGDSAVELNMWVLQFENDQTLLIVESCHPQLAVADYAEWEHAYEASTLATELSKRLGARELSVQEVQATCRRPYTLVCPRESGQPGFRHFLVEAGADRDTGGAALVTRDPSELGIERDAIWHADHVAIEAVRELGDAEVHPAVAGRRRNPWGVIVVSGARIVSAPGLAVAALAVNGDCRVLALAEETESLERRQLYDRSPMDWAASGGDRGKVYPVWILREHVAPTRVDVSGHVKCMDVSPDGSLIALLEWGKDPVLAVIEASNGLHRVLKVFPARQFTQRIARLHGDERVAFSPDGMWILVSGDTGGSAVLVDVASGAVVDVPSDDDRGATWWPHAGPSTLLLWTWNRDMDTELASFDLATLSRSALGAIRIPETPGLNYERRVLSGFSAGPDGQYLLCTTFLGPPAEHQEQHASSPRWAVARLISGDSRYAAQITEIAPWALNGDPTQELTHRAVQWTGKGPEQPVTLHPSLLASARAASESGARPHPAKG